MEIKVLGPGCAKCKNLEHKVIDIIKNHSIDAEFEKVSDIQEIMKYGILMTPGLVINGKVKSTGMLPKEEQILEWIREEMK